MSPGRKLRFLLALAGALSLLIGTAALARHLVSWSPDPAVSVSADDVPVAVASATPGIPWFVNVAEASGINFRHYDSITPMQYIQESLGSGLGWIDYNNDGWPDLFVVQAGPVRPGSAPGPLPTNKLYRNNGDGTFTDVTAEVGLARWGFGLGCAVGDFDNDGWS